MRTFELYLDESGEFINDSGKKSPSLVGGILVRNKELTKEEAIKIMEIATSKVDGNYKHINDIAKINPKLAGDVAINIMREIKNLPAQFVIFQNKELLDFQDHEKLYLHILVEGIMNLLEKLSLEKPDEISINITAAVRRTLNSDNPAEITEIDTYTKLIKERIMMHLAEKDLFISKNCHVSFKIASVSKNPRLDLADVVCNSMLTKESGKFTKEQREELNEMFNSSKYIFGVEKPDLQKKISNYLAQNSISDAFLLLNEIALEKDSHELESLLINHINNMSIINMRIQFNLLSLKIRSLIDVQRSLSICKNFLLKLRSRILSKITVKDYVINKLKLDVSLYLLTIYTHESDTVNAFKEIEIAKETLKSISGSWEFLDYYYILIIREAITYSSCFKEDKAILILTEGIERLKEIMKSFNKIEEFGNMQSDNLAKAYGTRLQSYTNLIYPNLDNNKKEEYYEKALNDSEEAIKNFSSTSDKKRQYQYRSALEASMEHIELSLEYLAKSLDTTSKDYSKMVNKIANIQDFSKHFLMNAYFYIMNMANFSKKYDIANQMYDAFLNNKELSSLYLFDIEEDEDTYNPEKISNTTMHPFETLYFNLGCYLLSKDKYQAKTYLDYAYNITLELDDLGIKVYSLAILSILVLASSDKIEAKNKLITTYNDLMENEDAIHVKEFLTILEPDILKLKETIDNGEIQKICTNIAYRIKI